MNSKGQVIFYSFMLGVVVIVLALAFAPTLKVFTDTARSNSTDTNVGLGCTNSSISDYDKGACTIVDLNMPYFIIGIVSLAGIVIGARVISG